MLSIELGNTGGIGCGGSGVRLEDKFILDILSFISIRGIHQIVGYIGLESMKEIRSRDKRSKSSRNTWQ